MADSDILRQIALLNPKIINGNDVDSMNDLIINSDSSSPQRDSQDDPTDRRDDNDILNLWSSTKIFFDPFDPSKINPTTQSQNNVNINSFHTDSINKLSEREIDRQRYTRLKQQKQSIYINRGRNNREDNVAKENNNNSNNNNANSNTNNNNILNIHDIHQLLMNDNNENNEHELLQTVATNNTTPHTITTSQHITTPQTITSPQQFASPQTIGSHHLIHNITSPLNNENPLNSINQPISLDKLNPNDGDTIDDRKGKDLYTQLLNSVNSNKRKNTKEIDTSTIIKKTNESHNLEIADKKKRRSAATMRCRERKKNQLQKKEQYIKYLENQILFLNGSILHMSNEINWLRRSFLDQYGEQSLKNIYMKNGFKNVNLSSVLYPGGSTPSPSFTNASMLSPEISSPGSHTSHSPEIPETNLAFDPNTSFLPPISSTTGSSPSHSLLSNFSPVTATTSLTSKDSNLKTSAPVSAVNTQTMTSLLQKRANDTGGISSSSNFLSSFSAPTGVVAPSQPVISELPKTTSIEQNEIFKHLDMETLNEFASLSKEQRDVLLKILEKQQELSAPPSPKPTATVTSVSVLSTPPPPPQSRNYINIANDLEANNLSKQPNSLLNLAPTTTTNAHPFNLLSIDHSQNDLNSLSFHTTSMGVTTTQPSISSASLPSTSNQALALTTTTSELNIIPTTTSPSSEEYINLENLIYYI